MSKQINPTSYTPQEQEAIRRELSTLAQARAKLAAVVAPPPDLQEWIDRQAHVAYLIEETLQFMLSGRAKAAVVRFASEIDHPRFLLKEIEDTLKRYEEVADPTPVLRPHAIYTIGYGGNYYHAALQQVRNHSKQGIIVDTRHVPYTKLVGFSQDDLQREYGKRYVHIPALGNKNYQGGPIALVNEEAGLCELEKLLAEAPILLLCGCTNVMKCHRRYIADKLRERTGAAICHLLTSLSLSQPAKTPEPVEKPKTKPAAKVQHGMHTQLSLFDAQ